jgi:5-formyltetrahydrofolate cyclo-ligase
MSTPKAVLRKALRAARRAIPPSQHAARSLRAAQAIMRLPRFRAPRRVAVYLPFDGETATAALIAAGRRRGVRLFVPVIADRRHCRLKFCRLDGGTRRGTYGIEIPRRSVRTLGARWFDLIVVPLVGIDSCGRRLGLGKGFYDRIMAFRRVRTRWPGPQLAGFAFDLQCVGSVHADPWDVRLDLAATESGLRFFEGSPSPGSPR